MGKGLLLQPAQQACFDQFTQYKGQKKKKTILFYSGLWLEGEQVTKPGKSSVVFG